MRFYRVCVIDSTDSVRDIRLIEAAGDQDALAEARVSLGPAPALEIWDQGRLVGRLSPAADVAAFAFTAAEQNAPAH